MAVSAPLLGQVVGACDPPSHRRSAPRHGDGYAHPRIDRSPFSSVLEASDPMEAVIGQDGAIPPLNNCADYVLVLFAHEAQDRYRFEDSIQRVSAVAVVK